MRRVIWKDIAPAVFSVLGTDCKPLMPCLEIGAERHISAPSKGNQIKMLLISKSPRSLVLFSTSFPYSMLILIFLAKPIGLSCRYTPAL
jgi:hypothetical protein